MVMDSETLYLCELLSWQGDCSPRDLLFSKESSGHKRVSRCALSSRADVEIVAPSWSWMRVWATPPLKRDASSACPLTPLSSGESLSPGMEKEDMVRSFLGPGRHRGINLAPVPRADFGHSGFAGCGGEGSAGPSTIPRMVALPCKCREGLRSATQRFAVAG